MGMNLQPLGPLPTTTAPFYCFPPPWLVGGAGVLQRPDQFPSLPQHSLKAAHFQAIGSAKGQGTVGWQVSHIWGIANPRAKI